MNCWGEPTAWVSFQHKKVTAPTRQRQQVLARMWRKGKPFMLLGGMSTGVATMENSLGVPQKTKNRTTIGPSNPLLGIYLKK